MISRLGAENRIKVIPSIGAATLGALNDVDISNIGNGYILVYDGNINKWTATNILTPGEEQNLIINGGNF
jgi:hypothetical protein